MGVYSQVKSGIVEKVFDCFVVANLFLKQVFIKQNEKCLIS